MKYSKFIQDVEDLGYCAVDTGTHLYITTERGSSRMLLISKTETCNVKSTSDRFNSISARDKEELFNLAVELATTPLKDREEKERKYRLKFPGGLPQYRYLVRSIENGGYFLGTGGEGTRNQALFTMKEIECIRKKHNLDSFIMEEAKEDE